MLELEDKLPEKRAKFPKFKKKGNKQSVRFPQSCKLDGDYLTLPKLKKVYCKVSRLPVGTLKSVTVSMTPSGKYLASCLYDDGQNLPEQNSQGKAVGIDLGISDFAITSDGSKYGNPKHYRKYEQKLAVKQKRLAKTQKGSNNRHKARKAVAKVHEKITRCREDFLHKLSRKLVDENQVIVVENLAVKNMVKNHKLAKSISDCGWGQFRTMLKYKAEWSGKYYIEVDRFFPSSKTCNHCLNQMNSLSLDIRSWQCPKCETVHDNRHKCSQKYHQMKVYEFCECVICQGKCKTHSRQAVGHIAIASPRKSKTKQGHG
jgi:putative transposase